MAALNRLSQRIKENFQETTRDLTILSGAGASTTYFDTSDEKLKEITKLLESRSDREKLEGMKRIIAGMSKGRDMEPFFAQVVKNVVSSSIEIRKLVYIYLLRFASTNSDLVLLSINTFQKDLSDSSPLIRSMSLRVLTSIRVPVIQGIVMLGLKKLVNDRNPWVRKTVAGGLAKVYEMDPSALPQLISLLQNLLSSPSPLTLGASLTAFLEMCPSRLDLLHPFFRHICRLIVDADEWGQAVALEVLIRYARVMLEKPDDAGAVQPTIQDVKHQQGGHESEDDSEGIDVDLAMLLHCIKPLLQSRNPAVVLATAKTYWHLAPAGHTRIGQQNLVKPLLRLTISSASQEMERKEIASITWEILAEMVEERPWLFKDSWSAFFVYIADSPIIQKSKIRSLVALVTSENAKESVKEFKHYIRFPNDSVAEAAIQALGICIRSQPEVAPLGLSVLVKLLKSEREKLVAQAIIVLKSVILTQSFPASSTSLSEPRHLVARLAKGLDNVFNPSARASVYWLVGQFASIDAGEESEKKGLGWEGVRLWVPDVLRKAIKGFVNEAVAVKLQILSFATKIITIVPLNIQLDLLSRYLFQLARYDIDYEVRDRARFLNALLRGVTSEKSSNEETNIRGEANDGRNNSEQDTGGVILRREQVKYIVFSKSTLIENDKIGESKFTSGGLEVASSSIIGRRLKGYQEVPEWADDPTDSSLRDSEASLFLSLNNQSITLPSVLTDIHNQLPTVRQISSPVPKRNTHSIEEFVSSPMDSSPGTGAGSAARTVKSKFQDLDAFLNSETDSEGESESETDSESEEREENIHSHSTAQMKNAVREYEYDTGSSDEDGDKILNETGNTRLYRA
nr:AP-3 complex subunit beta [Cryptococcus depauperatus CBS 7855]